MRPIGDDKYAGGPPPLVTTGLVALNLVAFFVELSQPSSGALQSLIQAWGVVPREYEAGRDLAPGIPLPFSTPPPTSPPWGPRGRSAVSWAGTCCCSRETG